MFKNLRNLMRYTPKGLVPVLAAVVALAVPSIIMAWGPERPIYTMANPANHVTFNSITDNPNYGDERQFVTVRDAAGGAATDSANLQPGHEYVVQIYIHNDAAANYNDSGVGIAKDVKVRAQIPTSINGEQTVDGFISASNASPKEVYDSADLRSNDEVKLEYVPGSGEIVTHQQTTKLPDTLVSGGVTVGNEDLSGNWKGCIEYAGAVSFKIRVKENETPNFTFDKKVSKHGANQFTKSYTAKPGETVDYALDYKNTGNTTMNNVKMSDTLPAGMTYVAGSAKLYNANNPAGASINDGVTSTGLNIGNYSPGANATLTFSATAPAETALQCGNNKLTNKANAETDSGKKDAEADIAIKKDCVPVKPAAKLTCTGLAVTSISRTQFTFKASHAIENATFVKYVYTVKDANGATVKTIETGDANNPVAFETNTVGKYTVTANVVANIDGQEKTVSSSDCQKTFEVTSAPETATYSCDYLKLIEKTARDTMRIEVKANAAGGAKVKEYRIDFGNGVSKIVGVGGEQITYTYPAAGTYTVKATASFDVKGQTISGITSDNCDFSITIDQPPATPVATLPSTGPEALAFSGLAGSSILGYGVHVFARSRRDLKKALLKK